jgi:hypothetical protein
MATPHLDDHLHPPSSDDPYWPETCWFTFAVPERRVSGQLSPFFRPNQRVTSGGAFFWDESGTQIWNCLYAKNFWHLPLPEGSDLTDLSLPNGIRYRCLEPLSRYELHYLDPDDEEVEVHLTFEGICEPNRLAGGHLDQPGRYTGSIRIRDDVMDVDAYGMRDRSWGVRSQFGATLHGDSRNGGYTYATASEQDAWHMITGNFGDGSCVAFHGFLLQDGEWARLEKGSREVLERKDGHPTRVRVEGTDALGRSFEAMGTCLNHIGVHLNPNLWTWNALTEWHWGRVTGYGEDHDNWSAAGFRRFVRGEG